MMVFPPTAGVHKDERLKSQAPKCQFQLVTRFCIVTMDNKNLFHGACGLSNGLSRRGCCFDIKHLSEAFLFRSWALQLNSTGRRPPVENASMGVPESVFPTAVCPHSTAL